MVEKGLAFRFFMVLVLNWGIFYAENCFVGLSKLVRCIFRVAVYNVRVVLRVYGQNGKLSIAYVLDSGSSGLCLWFRGLSRARNSCLHLKFIWVL